jgi:hypothetical protein
MKKITIILSNLGRILTITKPSELSLILYTGETVSQSWYYENPDNLESFLMANVVEIDDFAKGFAYWIRCKTFKIQEKQNRYGIVKRELSKFSKKLFKAIRSLAGRIANQIQLFLDKLNPSMRPKRKKHR